MSSTALISGFQAVSLLGALLTVAKLFHSGLSHKYPVLCAFLIFFALDSTTPFFLDFTSQTYQKVWVASEPLLWAFEIMLVRELYKLVLSKYRGLFTLWRWAMYVSVILAALLSLLSLLPRITPAMPQASRIMGYVLAVERGVDLSLALFLLLMLLFLSLYPTPVPRNVLVHAVIYSVFFLSNTLGVLVRVIFGLHLQVEVNVFLLAVSALCTLGWFALLTERGEDVGVNLPWISAQDEERLLGQLEALNATALKVSRR